MQLIRGGDEISKCWSLFLILFPVMKWLYSLGSKDITLNPSSLVEVRKEKNNLPQQVLPSGTDLTCFFDRHIVKLQQRIVRTEKVSQSTGKDNHYRKKSIFPERRMSQELPYFYYIFNPLTSYLLSPTILLKKGTYFSFKNWESNWMPHYKLIHQFFF